jgi:pseudaminic acid biosynthesis-associated methylase
LKASNLPGRKAKPSTKEKPKGIDTALTKPVEVVSSTADLWAGTFGNSYTERNRVNWRARVPFWESAIQFCTPATVFEFGCNAGWNLLAIQQVAPNTDLFGVDLSSNEVNEARGRGLSVQQIGQQGIAGLYDNGTMDLVFTAGVLIHVPPSDLDRVMRSLVDLSGRYVIAVEYHADQQTEVEYRGLKGALWKRDYGKLYQAYGLNLLSQGPAQGFDDCEYYLLEKAQ